MHKQIDVYEFINKAYGESSLYELSEALSILSKSISKKSYENKELISSHFSKFVECRSVLENIFEDIKSKGLNQNITSDLEKTIKILNKKYNSLFSILTDDIEQDSSNNRRVHYENEFVEIFTLKANLSKNVNNFENFVNLYKRALKIYQPYKKSEFLTSKMNDVKPEIKMFLDNVYGYISSEALNFNECCYYFDLYFEITQDKTDRKIMNTLLVTFKESTYVFDDVENFDEYIEYLEASICRFISYVDDDIKKSGINHYFKCIYQIVKNARTAKIAFKKSKMLGQRVNFSSTIYQYFMQKMAESKNDVFFKLLKQVDEDEDPEENEKQDIFYFESKLSSASTKINIDFKKSSKIFYDFNEILLENERIHIQEILIDHIKATIEEYKFEPFDFFQIKITDIRKCLGSRSSIKNKQLDKFIMEKKERYILKLSEEFEEMIEKKIIQCKDENKIEDSIIEIFMHILYLKENTSEECIKNILFESKEAIIKNKVIFWFLHKFVNMSEPNLTGKENALVEKISPQFNFLKA
ncbi:hypothetical protein EHP00_271 [Ecytonucleospora hepatopenaei]|uniref:Exocyst complex component EXOC2/Sec5 N-terminal domain-containing protein n=1 Tax=Ecytonucleospora hepatopenaei TaxID=646526 RepID=A0A1W0E7J8_9MICR|nr:hypothetical protein EHP00_271 [Ecytonucleospora hepatopenaei]